MNNTLIIIVAGVLIGLLVLGVLWVMMGKKSSGPAWAENAKARMLKISQSINSSDHGSLKLAVMEYDKLADFILQQQGLPGQTMGDRMKMASRLFPSNQAYQDFWAVHKVRNQLAHEIDSSYNNDTLMQVCISYRRVIESLIG